MTTIPFVDEVRLVALIHNPATMRQQWAVNAACRDRSQAGDPYFPEDDGMLSAAALARCAGCPVAYECLALALIREANDGYRFGWWGGFSPGHRRRARLLGAHRIPLPGRDGGLTTGGSHHAQNHRRDASAAPRATARDPCAGAGDTSRSRAPAAAVQPVAGGGRGVRRLGRRPGRDPQGS